MNDRSKLFDHKLGMLLAEFTDVPAPYRSFSCFMSAIALAEFAKGSPLTADEVAKLCARFTQKLHGADLVKFTAS